MLYIVSPCNEAMLKTEILARQEWLTTLQPMPAACASHTLFPRWDWDADALTFQWKAKIPDNMDPPNEQVLITANYWHTCCTFMNGLRWKVQPSRMTSYAELAVSFHARQFSFPSLDKENSYGVLTNQNKFLGKTLPAGVTSGAFCWMSSAEFSLLAMAKLCSEGACQPMHSWSFLLQFVSN